MQASRCGCDLALLSQYSILFRLASLAPDHARPLCNKDFLLVMFTRLVSQAVSAGGNFMRGYQAIKCVCLQPAVDLL